MAQNRKTQRKFRRKSSKKNVGKRKTKVKRRVKKGGLRGLGIEQFMFKPTDSDGNVLRCSGKEDLEYWQCKEKKLEKYKKKATELPDGMQKRFIQRKIQEIEGEKNESMKKGIEGDDDDYINSLEQKTFRKLPDFGERHPLSYFYKRKATNSNSFDPEQEKQDVKSFRDELSLKVTGEKLQR